MIKCRGAFHIKEGDYMLKDEVILNLGRKGNVAQFVSFDPEKRERFHLIHGHDDSVFSDHAAAITAVFNGSPAGTVNIRTFRPEDSQTPEFIFGIESASEAITKMEELAARGLHTIVHETIPLDDGGVSGIVQNGLVEFAPGVTPRFVENAGDKCAQMTLSVAIEVLKRVYGFVPAIDVDPDVRLEFSVHPKRCGYAKDNTIVWEHECLDEERKVDADAVLEHGINSWPHSFSKHIGDKAYGLVVASALGFDVPYTSVFTRNDVIPMFGFGVERATGPSTIWTRTCPIVQEPGLFSTIRACPLTPYQLMDKDDPEGDRIASCILQDGIESKYSGSTITSADGEPIIEGVKGFGDDFMTGDVDAEDLPSDIVTLVMEKYVELFSVLGDVRFEWAYDGDRVWVLQLHMGATESSSSVIYPGEFDDSVEFVPSDGLPVLRELIDNINQSTGVIVKGHIGITSHVADVLRKAKVPSVIDA